MARLIKKLLLSLISYKTPKLSMKLKALFFLVFISKFAAAQNGKDFLYFFDKDWKPVDEKHGVYLLHVEQKNDSDWQYDYYNIYGPLIKTQHFQDKDGKVLNGKVYYYTEKGILDSGGTYVNGNKNGDFGKTSSTKMEWKTKYIYRNDTLIETIDVAKKFREEAIEDSIRKSKGEISIDKESEYSSENTSWGKYLQKNLRYPDRALRNESHGFVVVSFIIDTEGNVIDPYISRSVEYSLDMESLQLIIKSGKWVPANHNSRNVRSFKIQPFNYKMETK
jgi:periplasmic protein TonB